MLDLITDRFKHDIALCPPIGPINKEKRTSPRFPWFAEVVVILLPALEAGSTARQVLKAETENIGKGGFGILCDQYIEAGTVVRCDIAFSGRNVQIPTILRVRWIEFLEEKKRYRLGLMYLI